MEEKYQINFEKFLSFSKLDKQVHQVDGLKWCIEKETTQQLCNVTGGIVADEMGLGKTILMLALICSRVKYSNLIILPTALLTQWESIIKKRLGHKVLVYHGYKAKHISPETLQKAPIVLTTYGMLYSKNSSKLINVKWGRVICDEAHHMRNNNSKKHESILTIKYDHIWLLTGTPIQNKKKDFYSLCDILNIPKRYYHNEDNFKNIVSELMLRRTKKDIGLNLRGLTTENINIDWSSSSEKTLSKKIHKLLNLGSSGFNIDELPNNDVKTKLKWIIRARQTCIMPPLLHDKINTNDDVEIQEGMEKTSKLDDVVNKILSTNKEDKKLVFCHFTDEIDLIQNKLVNIDPSYRTNILDGRLTMKQRQNILENPVDVLFLQIQTGCEGLNLQEYNEIYFVSPNWNPSVEDQAIARCHRMGQTKEVKVYNFIMNNIDEIIRENDNEETKTYVMLDNYIKNRQLEKRELQELVFALQENRSEIL